MYIGGKYVSCSAGPRVECGDSISAVTQMSCANCGCASAATKVKFNAKLCDECASTHNFCAQLLCVHTVKQPAGVCSRAHKSIDQHMAEVEMLTKEIDQLRRDNQRLQRNVEALKTMLAWEKE